MSKRYRETIEVTATEPTTTTDAPGSERRPTAFRWRGSSYRVLGILGHWREDAGYWAGGQVEVPQRDLWRVEARNGAPASGVYELVREGETWRLDRVWD